MNPYFILIVIGWTLGVSGGSFWYGYSSANDKCEAKKIENMLNSYQNTIVAERKQVEISQNIDKRHQKAVNQIKTVTKVVTKEVPKYVNTANSGECFIPNGFVLVHDAAAMSTTLPPTSISDGEASGIALTQIAETVVDNYGSCNEIRQQLISLQEWVNETNSASN